jgi:hypothetical protein
MTILDADRLTHQDLVAQYVIECRSQGVFLPYDDHQIIEEWLAASPQVDDLLVVLADVLPDYFGKGRDGPARTLGGVKKLVLRRLKDHAMRQGGV